MPKQNGRVNPYVIKNIVEDASTVAEGCRNVVSFVREGLEAGTFAPENFSIKDLGLALGALDPFDMESSFARACLDARDSRYIDERQIFAESNPTVTTNTFQIITSELIASKMIEGYETDNGYIGDQLVDVMPNQRLRNQRLTGLTSLAGPLEVKEGHPYEETGFEEKYVTTSETKSGRVLSLTEELVLFDQTAEIMRKARTLGEYVRQHRERTIVRGAIDADASTNPVYRPSGTGETLYATNASNLNWIGVGGLSGYDAAVALENWTDIDPVLRFRATQITDDRVDGTQRPIGGLNNSRCVLLVPMSKWATAEYIRGQTRGEVVHNSAVNVTHFNQNPVARFVGDVLASPLLDEVNVADWYYGEFKKQFVWTEIWPLQTFTLGKESADQFERDIAFRVKVRYYGGISATDTVYVTKVDGA